jgi:hypothetical protein
MELLPQGVEQPCLAGRPARQPAEESVRFSRTFRSLDPATLQFETRVLEAPSVKQTHFPFVYNLENSKYTGLHRGRNFVGPINLCFEESKKCIRKAIRRTVLQCLIWQRFIYKFTVDHLLSTTHRCSLGSRNSSSGRRSNPMRTAASVAGLSEMSRSTREVQAVRYLSWHRSDSWLLRSERTWIK